MSGLDRALSHPDEDRLGFDSFASGIATFIRSENLLPFTLGIYGPWGSGKTTLMDLVRFHLGSDPPVKTAWFDAWKYGRKELLWNALIQVILRRIHEDNGGKPEAKRLALALATTAAKIAARTAIKIGTQGLVSDAVLDDFAKQFSGVGNDNLYDYVEGFEDKFADVVKEYVGEEGRLVVFIDDLDRCLPEGAITVLESLKLFLDRSQCVFVIGVDQAALAEAIKTTYGLDAELLGRDYLDKIVQVSIPVPLADGSERFSALFGNEYDQDINQEVRKVVYAGIGGNPRRLKRFIYAFALTKALVTGVHEYKGVLIAVAVACRLRFGAFAEACAHNPQGLRRYYDLLPLSQGNKSADDDAVRTNFSNDGCSEFAQFWEDTDLRHFIQSLKWNNVIALNQTPINEIQLVFHLGSP